MAHLLFLITSTILPFFTLATVHAAAEDYEYYSYYTESVQGGPVRPSHSASGGEPQFAEQNAQVRSGELITNLIQSIKIRSKEGVYAALQGLHTIAFNQIEDALPLAARLVDLLTVSGNESLGDDIKRCIARLIRGYACLAYLTSRDGGQRFYTKTQEGLHKKINSTLLHLVSNYDDDNQAHGDMKSKKKKKRRQYDSGKLRQVNGLRYELECAHAAFECFGNSRTALDRLKRYGPNTAKSLAAIGAAAAFAMPGVVPALAPALIFKGVGPLADLGGEGWRKLQKVLNKQWYEAILAIEALAQDVIATNSTRALSRLQRMLNDDSSWWQIATTKRSWHVCYTGIDALLRILFESDDHEVQKQAYFGQDVVRSRKQHHLPGIIDYFDFDKKRWLRTNHTWRVREKAIEAAIFNQRSYE